MNRVSDSADSSPSLATLICKYEIAADALAHADAAKAVAATEARGCLQRLVDRIPTGGAVVIEVAGVRRVLVASPSRRAEDCRVVPLVEVAL